MALFRGRRRGPRAGHVRVGLLLGGLVLGVLVVIAGLAAIRIATIANDLKRARTLILSASADIEQGQLGPARTSLAAAQQILVTTNGDLYGRTELDLVGWVPVVSENLESLRTSIAVALQMVDGGNRLLAITQPLENPEGKLEVSMHQGAIPLKAVLAAEAEARSLAEALPTAAEMPSSSRLVGSISDLQQRIFSEADRRRTQLDNVSRALSILSDMSGANAPRRYLIAVANTAEMRGDGGMILSYGVLESSNGTFSLGSFGNIDELAIDSAVDPASLNLPSDYLIRWQGREPTRLWRNTTLSPDFRLAAPVMESMYTAATGLTVDGVIQIDPAGLAAILEGTGPVDVPGVGQVSAANVVDVTINRAYIDFPDRDQRQEISADVAKAAFHALIDGDFSSLRPFGTALFKAAASRHLIFYTNVSDVAAQVRFFGADGQLVDPAQQDSALLTVQNFGKNKLDYYVDTSLSVTGVRGAGVSSSLTATVTVTNSTPEGVAAEYVTGPSVRGQPYAVYEGIVSLYLPTGTTLAGSQGTDIPPSLTTEAGRTLVTYDISVPAGAASTVTLQLDLVPRPANRPYHFTFLPIGRVRPTTVAVDIDLGDGRRVQQAAIPLEKVLVVGAQSK